MTSLDDLTATKTIPQLVSTKDYTDIAAMMKAGVSLAKGLAATREMFGESFQPSESLKAMIYFEGGNLHLLTPETKKTLAKAVSDTSASYRKSNWLPATLGLAEVNLRQRGETSPPPWSLPMN